MKACGNCGRSIVAGGVSDERGLFCSSDCSDAAWHQGFCESCVSRTTDASSGPTVTINSVGTKLVGETERCPTCRSLLQRLYFCILFIPLVPGPRYRVKYLRPDQFVSRQLPPSPGEMPRPWDKLITTKTGVESAGLVLIAIVIGLGYVAWQLILRFLD